MIKAIDVVKQSEDALTSILGFAKYFLETLKFDRKNPQQLYSVCLYARLFEIACGCKALLEKNALVGIPILLRSIFEAGIDLTSLMKCQDYYKRMYASFLKEKLRLTKEVFSSESNPFFVDIISNQSPKKDICDIQDKLDQLIAENNGPINIRDRAELAGKLDEYLSIYNMLCLNAHNNISALGECHLKKSADDNYHVVAFKQTKAELMLYLYTICEILLLQTKALADFLGIKDIEIDNYSTQLQKLAILVNENQKEKKGDYPELCSIFFRTFKM